MRLKLWFKFKLTFQVGMVFELLKRLEIKSRTVTQNQTLQFGSNIDKCRPSIKTIKRQDKSKLKAYKAKFPCLVTSGSPLFSYPRPAHYIYITTAVAGCSLAFAVFHYGANIQHFLATQCTFRVYTSTSYYTWIYINFLFRFHFKE